VTSRACEVEKVEYHQDKVIEIDVYQDGRMGTASISDIRSEAIHSAVLAACHIAQFTDQDPASGLARKEELAYHYPQLHLAYPWDISVEQAILMACQCEREALAFDKRIFSAEEASVNTSEGLYVYANSNGFLGTHPFTRHELSCVLIAKEGEDMQRDYSYTVAVDPHYLHSVSQVAKEAGERTIRRLGGKRLKTMQAPVIFIADEARHLLGHFVSAISGSSVYRKASFLVDHLDKKVFPDFVHIKEQPHLLRGLGSAPFDADGVATRPNIFIEQGILRQYALGVYSARKLGMETTGNAGGVHNLMIEPGTQDLAALLKTMGKGLLVTELMGHGVNIITGDYSRGASGFWVEHGEIQYPVHEITIAGKLQEMYAQIAALGSDVDRRGNILSGSILIENMMIAGE
jgi:PmbA protein